MQGLKRRVTGVGLSLCTSLFAPGERALATLLEGKIRVSRAEYVASQPGPPNLSVDTQASQPRPAKQEVITRAGGAYY